MQEGEGGVAGRRQTPAAADLATRRMHGRRITAIWMVAQNQQLLLMGRERLIAEKRAGIAFLLLTFSSADGNCNCLDQITQFYTQTRTLIGSHTGGASFIFTLRPIQIPSKRRPVSNT